IPLVKLATAGAFKLTTNGLAHEIVPLVRKIASFSPILGRKLAAWERAQGRNAGAAKGTKPRPSVVAAQHLKRTQDANAFLNLAGIGKKGRVRLDIGEAYFPLIARPTGVQDHGEFHRSPEQLKGVPTLNVENIFTVGHGCRAVVVLGEPGAGKSSVASRMAWERDCVPESRLDDRNPDGGGSENRGGSGGAPSPGPPETQSARFEHAETRRQVSGTQASPRLSTSGVGACH
ncbi:MAG: hypothetical protein ACKO3P_01380, partial [Planctomycetaceae bacterium]